MEIDMNNYCIAPTTFTPVRRRESTINPSRFQVDQEQEWTAARCHRLLRALTSRVAILKKEIFRYAPIPPSAREVKVEPVRRSKRMYEDADWTQVKKKARHTYSGRGRGKGKGDGTVHTNLTRTFGNGQKLLMPGEVSISTPILARVRGEGVLPQIAPTDRSAMGGTNNGPNKAGFVTVDTGAGLQIASSFREMRKRMTMSRFLTHEGIHTGLEVLLRSTAKEDTRMGSRGASSLLAISLRTVPKYISGQEKLLQAYNEENGGRSAITSRDMSAEIYDELEAIGYSGKSWKELRVVVRSHGIQVLSDAIESGLLDIEFCGSLVALCVSLSALDEAEVLLVAILHSSQFGEPKTVYDAVSKRLSMLWSYSNYTGRGGFHYRQLSKLILDEHLPVSWLATKGFSTFWTSLIQSIPVESISLDTSGFLETALLCFVASEDAGNSNCQAMTAACSALEEAVNNTFTSLLTTLLSICILSEDDQAETTCNDPHSFRQRLSCLLRSCIAQFSSTNELPNSRFALLLLTMILLNHHDIPDASNTTLLVSQLWKSDDRSLDSCPVADELVTFISDVARYCGRGDSSTGFDILKRLHLHLEAVTVHTEGGDIFKGIIVDSAFHFSQKVPDQQHLEYSTGLNNKHGERTTYLSRISMSQSFNDTRNGFRWEEGIGEWVTATPMIQKTWHGNPLRSAVNAGEMKSNTPVRKIPRRPGMKETSEASPIEIATVSSPLGLSHSEQSRHSETCDDITSTSLADSLSMDIDDSASEGESLCDISFASTTISTGEEPHLKKSSAAASRRTKPDQRPRPLQNTRNWPSCDESPQSSVSSSCESVESNYAVEYVNRGPRLGRRALRSSQTWQIFDDSSDDELSFLSVSSQDSCPKRQIISKTGPKAQEGREKSAPLKRRKLITTALSDSEDELCL